MAHHGSDREGGRASAPDTKATISVERITHSDVPEICGLYKRVWDSPPVTGLPSDLLKSWQPSPLEFTSWMEGVTYFAARRDGRLIGVIGCEVARGSCRLVNLAVDPEARRSGVGTALVGAAVDWSRHANVPEIWGSALTRFTAVAALFTHLGFAESGLLHRHEWGEDVVFFERIL
ncbi:MAG TPA: GNAT family N-acetyltransferase [Thermoplasmata archaeon]|nr:GNAT family N-acetyltransferase [Thermoplasmata archaeon]